LFYPKYNYSNGLIRPAGRKVAAVSKSRSRRRVANMSGGAGGLMGAGGGMMSAYSPVYERAEDPTLAEEFLPTDTQTQNKIFRNIIMFDPVAGPATEYWRDLAFSKHVRLGGIEDEKILRFYQDAIESSGIESEMPWLLNDYLTFGRFVMHMDFDDQRGFWTQLIVHDLDFVEINVPPFPSEDPIINIQPTHEHRDWAVSRDPRVMEQREKYDPEIIKLMAMGDPYPLPAEHTLFMARRAFATDYYGTSYLTRIIPFKIMEKALIDAEVAAARRRAGPVWVINVPEAYEADEIQEIIDQFFAIEEDPIGGKVAVREGVTVSPMGGGKSDFWTLSDEYDFLRSAKLNALGINDSFADGSATLASMEKNVELFVEKLRAIRTHFTEKVIIDKMLRGLARIHGYAKKPATQVAHRYRIAKREIPDSELIIPTVEWDRPLEPHADLDYWDLLERLDAKGIVVTKRKWAQAAGYDLDEAIDGSAADMKDRAKLYQIKSAQAKQAEDAGFDLEGNMLSGGEIGGGGGFGGGLLDDGPDFGELGGGEEGGLDFGGEGGGGEFEPGAPPLEVELPAAETPEAGPGGAGASMGPSRFSTERPETRFRYAMPNDYRDLERTLDAIAIWNDTGLVAGMTKRNVAQHLDRIAHMAPTDRDSRRLDRMLRRAELNSVQAGIVQYCATRLGFVHRPSIDSNTIRFLQHTLVDQANQCGLTKQLNKELEVLTRIAQAVTKTPSAGLRNLTSRDQQKVPDHQVLTGLL